MWPSNKRKHLSAKRPVPPWACLVRMRGSVWNSFQGWWVSKRAAGGILALYRRDLRSLSPPDRHHDAAPLARLAGRGASPYGTSDSRRRGEEREREGVVERGSLRPERGDENETSAGKSIRSLAQKLRATLASRHTGHLLVAGNDGSA